jgi:glycosyltransferase involved in cell wall biosynthesis
MRVLHLHSGNQFGGIERLLVTLAHASAREPSVEHTFALCFQGRLWSELAAVHAQLVHLGATRLARPGSLLRARRAVRAHIAADAPDIILTHVPWARVVFGPVLRKHYAPDVHWVHGCATRPGWLDRLAERHVPCGIIYNSEFTAATCGARFPQVPAQVLYPAVPPAVPSDTKQSVRDRNGTDADTVVIVQTSRMEPWKGHFDLIDAARLLPAEPPWVIWFAGGPQTVPQRRYYQRLQEHVARSGLTPHVRFLGELSDISSVLHASDIFCQPNEVPEPFGIAFVEAMSAGLPVVGTAIGAAPELVPADAGTLVGPHDPTALAEALHDLLGNAERRRAVGARGRARATAISDPPARIADLVTFLETVRSAA